MRVGALAGVLLSGGALAASAQPAAVAEQVTAVGSLVTGEGPVWSPDGRRVLFASTLGGPALWAVPAGGGTPVRLTRDIAPWDNDFRHFLMKYGCWRQGS